MPPQALSLTFVYDEQDIPAPLNENERPHQPRSHVTTQPRTVQTTTRAPFLAWKGIIHRDVKPENILYISQPGGQYQFQLGDFGLCNRAVDAMTYAGSELYMAPKMFRKGGQTSKLDVWSLFVTML